MEEDQETRPAWVRWAWLGYVLATLLAVGGIVLARRSVPPPASAPGTEAAEIVFSNPDGSTFRLSEQRGRVVVVTFGYTACPDVCPITLSKLKSAWKKLGQSGQQLQVVFVSVDPERDDASRVTEYAHAFDPRFQGVSLSGDALATTLAAYRVTAQKRMEPTRTAGTGGAGFYTVDHTGGYFLIDRRGHLRERLPYGSTIEALVGALEQLLAEKA